MSTLLVKSKVHHQLYFYVVIAIFSGILIGHFSPATGVSLKLLSDVFIRLIKMIITPVVFLTVTLGIANLKDLKKAGRIGLKAILYFELVTTLALLIGLIVVNTIRPGDGFNKKIDSISTSEFANYIPKEKENLSDLIYKVVPSNIFDPFIKGEVLQVLFLAILSGIALSALKESGAKITRGLEYISELVFKLITYLMYFAPLGALGAMAFTIGKFGLVSLIPLIKLMLCVYITCFLFILIILGGIAWRSGFSILKFIRFIHEEIVLVFGTSSSESALPKLMQKMEKLGCSKAVTGLVIPTGYSFNLDGTSIYLIMAAVFIAQATNTKLTWGDELLLIGVFMLTSKGAAAVTGGGLVTLAATLATMDKIPLAGITLVVGVDRFMSEARAITNLIGNGVATVVISNWEKETAKEKMEEELNRS